MPVPMSYRGIADDVAERITRGEFSAGQALPSYNALALEYGVSYATAARAYGLLRDRGVIIGAVGRGVFVAEKPTP